MENENQKFEINLPKNESEFIRSAAKILGISPEKLLTSVVLNWARMTVKFMPLDAEATQRETQKLFSG